MTGAAPPAALAAQLNDIAGAFARGNYAHMESVAAAVAAAHPGLPDGWKALGVARIMQGGHRAADALAPMQRAASLLPDDAEAQLNLAGLLKDLRRLDEARRQYAEAARRWPGNALAHEGLGIVLQALRRPGEAEAHFRRVVALQPGAAKPWSRLAWALHAQGRPTEAVAMFRESLARAPSDLDNLNGLLFAMQYDPQSTAAGRLEAARVYGRAARARVSAPFAAWRCANPPAPLRVGIVSGDLGMHPVGYFVAGSLAAVDRARAEFIAYPTTVRADAMTPRLRALFTGWRPIHALDDRAAAALIEADGIHVLLDLSGHTGATRLPLFAWRPAPVQASWIGDCATTGLAEMDYFIADPVLLPEGAEARELTETPWRLPDSRFCFSAPPDAPEPAPPPARAAGHVTFGCFQNLAKVNDDVLAAWSAILAAVPGSRLRMQCRELADPGVCVAFSGRLAAAGIDPARVAFHGEVAHAEYLAAHAEVDVALNTFPFGGVTTVCEALWMGVPTLTLAGDSMRERDCASVLSAAGCADWVVATRENYIALAVAHARGIDPAPRRALRERMRASPLMDSSRFARHFEAALYAMWASRPRG